MCSSRWLNFRIGRLSRALSRNWGWCQRCQTTWKFVRWHTTRYDASNGCFPLCELCWGELTPAERLPYYAELVTAWLSFDSPREEKLQVLRQWPAIEAAVLEGK